MFEQLFTRPGTIERYQTEPLVVDRLKYLVHCAQSGVERNMLRKIAVSQLHLVRLLDLKEDEEVKVSRVNAAAREWSRPRVRRYGRPASLKATAEFAGRSVRWLRFLGRLAEPKKVRHSHSAEVAAYAAWMREERGLSEATIRGRCVAADEFFNWLAAGGIPLASVTITDIDQANAAKNASKAYSRVTIRTHAQRLRAFFRFAEDQRWCTPGLAAAIIPPRVYRDETVPAGLSRADVLRLLATTEGDRPVDTRDRAILMLFATYGLRCGEVAGLQLDDLDWEEETLRVRRSKSGRTHRYPMSRGVAQAIVRYVREVRPVRQERTVFLTLCAPFRPLGRSALYQVVRSRMNRLSLVPRHRGPHALRHATAQHLLDQGQSMKVIGDYLGHRNPSSVSVYAKVDLGALREVADFDLEGLS